MLHVPRGPQQEKSTYEILKSYENFKIFIEGSNFMRDFTTQHILFKVLFSLETVSFVDSE